MIKTKNHLPSGGDKEELLDTTHKKNSPSTAESGVHCHPQRRRRVAQIRDAMKTSPPSSSSDDKEELLDARHECS